MGLADKPGCVLLGWVARGAGVRLVIWAAVFLAGCVAWCLAGCGTPGAPQPPSLNLPDRVADLEAKRTGDEVKLTWTMPKRTTDKVLLKANVDVRVCRKESAAECVAVTDVSVAPAAKGTYIEHLPAGLNGGGPRPLRYFVELRNRRGRSAGLSNAAVVLAGQAPAPVVGLAAEVRKSGVGLGWNAGDLHDGVRLERTLLNPPASKAGQDNANQDSSRDSKKGPLGAPEQPLHQNLIVASDEGRALDKDITFGQTYEYRAQRVAQVDADGGKVELDGEWSAPVRIEAADVFPPAVPTGVEAVATAATADTPASIDLNWQPVTDADLAGYFVYRREADTPWRRISGEQPVVGPAFHDTQVTAGHKYTYGVSAVDHAGHESTRSADAEETVPQS